MSRISVAFVVSLIIGVSGGCARHFPQVALEQVDADFRQRCAGGPGALIYMDERYDDYWGGGYDPTSYLLVGEEGGDSITAAPTKRMTVRRSVIKILSKKGAVSASHFKVIHYRENAPPVEVHLWMGDGTPKMVNIQAVKTGPLVDWPCENGFPRETTFRIGPLLVGDVVEIIYPISGPDQLRWSFGSDQFCVSRSRVSFGHKDDEFRPDMDAKLVDASGGVKLASEPNAYPMVFELRKALMPISHERLPFVMLSPRCPNWKNLRGRIFRTALWMARAGKIAGHKKVNPFLVTPIKENQKARRIQATAEWMYDRVKVVPDPYQYWLRWMPTEPAHKTARKRFGSAGAWSALTFRILEEAGLKPRFALIHTNPLNPFGLDSPAASQMDTLAVVVDDETGKTHWLVPTLRYSAEDQPPSGLRGHKALLLERWWIDREQGAGRCSAEVELTFSCQTSTPEPVELELVSIGYGDKPKQEKSSAPQ
ncbi:MAG TPA: hypothetical protein VM425_07060 [Myxococcota bacterium]|nr:hypothetical protein [Myxococcota bacterium]